LEEDHAERFSKQLRHTDLAEHKAGSGWPRTMHTDDVITGICQFQCCRGIWCEQLHCNSV